MKNRSIRRRTLYIIAVAAVMAVLCPVAVFPGTPYTGGEDDHVPYDSVRSLSSENNEGAEYRSNRTFTLTTDGTEKPNLIECRIKAPYGDAIWFGQPTVQSCSSCAAGASDPGLYSARIFIEDNAGNELFSKPGVRLSEADFVSIGADMSKPIRVGIEVTQKPGAYCSSCGRHLGDCITVSGIFWHERILVYASQPASVSAPAGGAAVFEVKVSRYVNTLHRPLDFYKWEKWNGSDWMSLDDGIGEHGETYSGCDTSVLTVGNLKREINGSIYRCVLKGANYTKSVSGLATLTVTAAVQPTSVPTPSPSPTADPAPSPKPTEIPALTPTPAPAVTPKPGGKTDYAPSASSSAYTGPASSSSSSSSRPGSSGSSSSSSRRDEDEYRGGIDTGTSAKGSSSIKALDPGGPSSGTSAYSRSSSGRNKDERKSSSSSSVSRLAGSSTVMRNGVLYIVDDENAEVGADGGGGGEDTEESYVTSPDYLASDLAIEGELREQNREKGFFGTAWGIAVIIASALIVLLLALFFLFFGVLVFGEVEEHDEVFVLCAVRLMIRRNGEWYVKLGAAFDDNAVLKLRIGIVFAAVFDGWDITGETAGMHQGEITGQVQQNMLLHRKNIRRNV